MFTPVSDAGAPVDRDLFEILRCAAVSLDYVHSTMHRNGLKQAQYDLSQAT